MKRLFTLMFLVGGSLFASAQSPAAVPRQIPDDVTAVKAQEEALRQAELQYDSSAANALLAEGFVLTAASDGNLYSKQQFLPLIGDKSDPMEILEYGEMDVRVHGDAAVVLSTVHERFWYQGKPIEYSGRRTAMWIKRNQTWLCAAIHVSALPPKLPPVTQTALSASNSLPRSGNDSVESTIIQLEKDFSDAEVKPDISRVSELLSDDWTDTEDDGTLNTKADILKVLTSPTMKLASDTSTEIHVRQYGNTAVVTLLDTAVGTFDGKDIGGQFRLTDTWVMRDGKWRMVALHSSRIKKQTCSPFPCPEKN
jgi:ketosteroid isomerase-like protein